ncbi:hypothetical protein ROA7450_00595 [Roseovarius albus]|uniref:DNA mimic protein DMP19 C-terminal domain-containing protein n=1 Tax=Roseovarius albus TaxID=1247867 RepID=A0A1X6YEX5_9RHOB|nr:DUF4375 domain-containing protein [Roseovarius albus]SLN18937.1 hypothetical protein ROA7450_00595 [Roseovarius albus]
MLHIFNAPREYPSVYLPYYDQFNFYDGRDVWLKSISGIPQKAVHLFCIHWLHLEVYNGGFWQYFYNSTGVSASEARDGFLAIGMREVASIVESAMAELGEPFPFDKRARESIVGPPDDRIDFGELDDAFYALADTDQFFRKLPKFVPYADAYAKSN